MKCPACKEEALSLWMGGQLGMIYFCKKCGYRGPVTIEEYKEVKGSARPKA